MTSTIKIGDKVKSDLDGLEYTVVKFGSRNELMPLPGVYLLGNCMIAERPNGLKIYLLEQDVTPIS